MFFYNLNNTYSNNHYYEKFDDGSIKDITDEIFDDIPNNWQWIRLHNVLDYIQPNNYIVNSEKYNDSYKTPVLTAGKSFVLGYTNETEGIFDIDLPVIIFDDFTTSTQFVDFEFKVKSSAMKILKKTNKNLNTKYIYYAMQTVKINTNTHKRYWISDFSNKLIPLPPKEEQKRIVLQLENLLKKIKDIIECNSNIQNYKSLLKEKILDLAIKGKLVEHNLNDESADTLINKIIEEKHKLMKEGNIKKENLSIIYKDTDNQFYEKFDNGKVVNISEEIPFDIPNNWCWSRLCNICSINPKNSLDDNLDVSFVPMTLIDGGYSNIHKYEVKKWKDIKKGFTHFKNNDIGIAKITPCFENRKSVIFYDLKNGFGAGTTELHILRKISNYIREKYLFYIIKSDYFINKGTLTYTGNVGQQRIHKSFLPNFLVPIPPFKEQNKIINKIENLFRIL